MESRFVLATFGIVLLGLMSIHMAISSRLACHYVREMLVGLGLYLVAAGVARLLTPLAGVDGGLTREATGWIAWLALGGLSWTALSHWAFHRFLREELQR